MAQSLNSPTPAAAATTPISTAPSKKTTTSLQLHFPCVAFPRISSESDDKVARRRFMTVSLAGAVLGFNYGERTANAAARRPPPPPPEERKDPNVSGVQAKVLASKKRKEAMKESVAKLREKGKPIN